MDRVGLGTRSGWAGPYVSERGFGGEDHFARPVRIGERCTTRAHLSLKIEAMHERYIVDGAVLVHAGIDCIHLGGKVDVPGSTEENTACARVGGKSQNLERK